MSLNNNNDDNKNSNNKNNVHGAVINTRVHPAGSCDECRTAHQRPQITKLTGSNPNSSLTSDVKLDMHVYVEQMEENCRGQSTT